MRAPCVRVPVADGEATRRALIEADLLDHELEIAVEDGWLYLPVVDAEAAAAGHEVTEHDVEARETRTLPADLLEGEASYERVGDVVLLHEDDPDRARAVAEAVMASDLPVSTVLNRASEIQGTERVREWDRLVGEDAETVHREYGIELAVDLASVYFSARLATERQRVVEQVEPGERAFDMFAGAGPFAVRLADAGAEVVAVDVNPDAVAYLRANAERNGVADRLTAIEGDVREVAGEYAGWADRIVMNLPHSADEFLEAAVAIAGEDCVLHYYDIQPEADPYAAGEAAIRQAAGDAYDVEFSDRRVVRSYAPGQVNVCLDARLRRR
ncbi:MAG: class I SAM-dependent methyltransferase family protein [Halobacteriales archaeon]|nr:class I SAM-dependent methyltransferase family protein [Halobacteriales archaeon]